jgi:hypothetical protein
VEFVHLRVQLAVVERQLLLHLDIAHRCSARPQTLRADAAAGRGRATVPAVSGPGGHDSDTIIKRWIGWLADALGWLVSSAPKNARTGMRLSHLFSWPAHSPKKTHCAQLGHGHGRLGQARPGLTGSEPFQTVPSGSKLIQLILSLEQFRPGPNGRAAV